MRVKVIKLYICKLFKDGGSIMKKLLLAILAVALGFGALACSKKEAKKVSLLEKIKKRGYIAVALEPGYMPFEMKTKSGELIGFDVEMMQLFAKKLGVKVKFVPTAWDGIIPALMTKDKDTDPIDLIASGMTVTEERAKKVNFSEPYFKTGQAFFVSKKSTKKIASYKDLDQKGLIIATKLGVTAEQACKKLFTKATIKLFKTEGAAATEVMNGRADVMVYDQPYIASFVKKNGEFVKAFLTPFTDEPLAMAFRKGDKDLLAAANAFIKEFKATEKYKELYKKYFVDMPWFETVKK